MEEEIFFDADSYYNSNQRKYSSITMINDFVNKISEKAEELRANKITTNANIASVIQDSSKVKFITNNTNKIIFKKNASGLIEHYLFAKLNETEIYVDPYMRWDDNHIYFEYDNNLLARELKLKTINKTISEEERKIKFGRVYSGFVRDTNSLLI